ncbi:YfiR family protein [Alkanindiges sp. WGS2144]|uniref:YfiR family protein n=1 Tax=Alkanindiges sp. WGS2144 TaxID=3366808 RepID=UPI003750ED78
MQTWKFTHRSTNLIKSEADITKSADLNSRACQFMLSFCACFFSGFAATASYANPAAVPVGPDPSTKHEEVARIVFGILSYTKWQPPKTAIEVCIAGTTKYALGLEDSILLEKPPKVTISKSADVSTLAGAQCDVIYFGDIPAVMQQKIISTSNRPLLTISELNPACELGSSFCLDIESSPISFKVNLDALARSGIHVNPNVLLLGRKKR